MLPQTGWRAPVCDGPSPREARHASPARRLLLIANAARQHTLIGTDRPSVPPCLRVESLSRGLRSTPLNTNHMRSAIPTSCR